MKVSELISILQGLNNDHFGMMKEVLPMGMCPDEPEIYLEQFDDGGDFCGYTKDIEVVLDMATGIQLIAM